MNQSNALHGDEPNKTPREWKNQHSEYNFKYRTSPSNPIPVVSDFLGILNNHAIDNGDVKVPTSEFPVEFNYESKLDPDTSNIKSIDDDGMNHLLESFHS